MPRPKNPPPAAPSRRRKTAAAAPGEPQQEPRGEPAIEATVGRLVDERLTAFAAQLSTQLSAQIAAQVERQLHGALPPSPSPAASAGPAGARPPAARAHAGAAPPPGQAAADRDRFWALEGLQHRDHEAGRRRGSVLYVGDVSLPGGARLAWQQQRDTEALLALDWAEVHDTVAALAHPVRLRILQACLGQARTPPELLLLDGMGTTGQLFHHLKALQTAGWLRSLQRGHYQVPGERSVPLLALLTTCLG